MSYTRYASAFFVCTLLSLQQAFAEEAVEVVHPAEGQLFEMVETQQEADVAAHHGGSGLPQFDPTSWPSQIFWMTVIFIVLYTIFSKAILPAISDTLQNRQQHIDTHIADAERLSKEAEFVEADLKTALREAGQAASHEIRSAEDEAKTRLDQALSSFRDRYDSEISSAENRISGARDQALQDMNKIAAELAAQAARKLAGISADVSQAESVVLSLSSKVKKAA